MSDGAAVQKYKKNILKQWSLHYSPPGVPGVSKNPEDQTEDHFGELER